MATLIPEIEPLYGETVQTDQLSWPSEDSGYYRSMRRWLKNLESNAEQENDENDQVKQIGKMIDYVIGRQWSAGRPSHKSKPVLNRMWRLLEELVGLLTDIRPVTSVKTLTSGDKSLEHQADIYNRCIRSMWQGSEVTTSLVLVIIHALFSTGYVKLDWDVEKRNGQGDFSFIPLGPSNVVPIKATPSGLDSAQGVIYRTSKPLSWFREKFPLRAHLVRPDPLLSSSDGTLDPPPSLSPYVFNRMSEPLKKLIGTPATAVEAAIPVAKYREFWLRDLQRNTSNRAVVMGNVKTNWSYEVPPGGRLYPRGRLVIMGGENVIMHDGPNPWWHGKPPFAMLRLNPVPWSSLGQSEIAPLIAPQDIVNQVIAGVLDMVKLAVNPGIIGPKNAFGDNAWANMDPSRPGSTFAYNQNVPNPPTFTKPPELPAFVLQVLGIASQEMDTSSGIAAFNRMVGKKQVPGGDTFDQVRNAQNTPIRLKGRMIESFMNDLGNMLVPSIAQFYGARRRMFMFGMDGLTNEDFDYDPGSMVPAGMTPYDHMRNFQFTVAPDSLLRLNQMDKIQALFKLRQMGDVDSKTLIESLDMGLDADLIKKRLFAELKEKAQLGIMPVAHHGGKKK